MDFVLYAADGMPRAFTMIGYTLEAYQRYKALNRNGQHVYWYRLGAKLGDSMGAYNLGQCYEVGRGVPRDMKAAVFWWRRAADLGCVKAMTNLAAAYYNGEGIRKSRKKALWFFGRASAAGDKLAKRMLNRLRFDN